MASKENIYRCQAEKHHSSCSCLSCKPRNCNSCDKLTKQHQIPRCIARKILGLSADEMKNHTILVSKSCHEQEDGQVPYILYLMKILKEQEGMVPTIEEVLTIRKMGMFRKNGNGNGNANKQ